MTAAVPLAVIKESSMEKNEEETSYDIPQRSCCKDCTGKNSSFWSSYESIPSRNYCSAEKYFILNV